MDKLNEYRVKINLSWHDISLFHETLHEKTGNSQGPRLSRWIDLAVGSKGLLFDELIRVLSQLIYMDLHLQARHSTACDHRGPLLADAAPQQNDPTCDQHLAGRQTCWRLVTVHPASPSLDGVALVRLNSHVEGLSALGIAVDKAFAVEVQRAVRAAYEKTLFLAQRDFQDVEMADDIGGVPSYGGVRLAVSRLWRAVFNAKT